jgi:tRNA (guanosine-2'-O-)-methyltransferase
LVFGEEHNGLSERAKELADGLFNIPQSGATQSLNISVAAAVSMYEIFRQKRMAGQDGSTLSEEQYKFLLKKLSAIEPRSRVVITHHRSE